MPATPVQEVATLGTASPSTAEAFPSPGGSGAALQRLNGPSGGGCCSSGGLCLSPELEEELQSLQSGQPDLNALNQLAGASPVGQGNDLQARLTQLLQKLQALQQQLQQQLADGDQQGAQGTAQEMRSVEDQLNGLFGGQSGAGPAGGGSPGGYAGGGSPGGYAGGGSPGGGAPAGGGNFSAPGAGAVDAQPTDFNGTPDGNQLAKLAYQHATDGTGDGGHCFRNVGDDLRKLGVQTSGEAAYMAADELAGNSRVQELKGISPDQLKKLPAGDIVVWSAGQGHPYGHISVSMGDGREASDVMRNQITSLAPGSTYRVFKLKG